MKKSTLTPIVAVYCLLTASCHRPYARYQPIPVESFHSPGKTQAVLPAADSDSAVVPVTDWVSLVAPSPVSESPRPEAFASAAILPPAPTVQQRVRQAATMVNQPVNKPESRVLPQPRPKAKAKAGQKKTLREILGLKPRKKLNWWQRIPWQLKASIPVIGVAIIFAVLHISILAIIFGLIGAFLLIRGLKKTFKVRRPWF